MVPDVRYWDGMLMMPGVRYRDGMLAHSIDARCVLLGRDAHSHCKGRWPGVEASHSLYMNVLVVARESDQLKKEPARRTESCEIHKEG